MTNPTITIDVDRIWVEITVFLMEGGKVQGSHHKAWYIDQIAQRMLTGGLYEIVSASDEWDKGIAP